MALILRDRIVGECVGYGRNVESEIRDNPNTKLTDDKLKELCQPLVNKIEKETDARIRSEIEEAEALAKDKEEEKEIENMCTERRANISESIIVQIKTTTGERTLKRKRYQVSHLERIDVTQKEDPDSVNVLKSIKVSAPELDIEDVDSGNILTYDTDDEDMDQYKKHIELDLESPYDEFVDADDRTVIELLEKHSSIGVLEILTNLYDMPITRVSLCNLRSWIDIVKIATL